MEGSPSPITSQRKKKGKSLAETEVEILCELNKTENLDLWQRICHSVTVKYEEMDALCKGKGIKMSKKDLMAFLDNQGIIFSLPEVPNAVNGPRRVRVSRKKRK